MKKALFSFLLASCAVAPTEPNCIATLAAYTGYESWTVVTLDISCEGTWNLNYGLYAGDSGAVDRAHDVCGSVVTLGIPQPPRDVVLVGEIWADNPGGSAFTTNRRVTCE